MQSEEDYNKQEDIRKKEYDLMHDKLKDFNDYQKYKHLLPPYIHRTYEDYVNEYKKVRTEKDGGSIESKTSDN